MKESKPDKFFYNANAKHTIAKAKYYLANLHSIEPQEAYLRMRKYSQDENILMIHIAKRVLRGEPIAYALGNRS